MAGQFSPRDHATRRSHWAQAGCSKRPCVFAGCGAFSDHGHATSLFAGASCDPRSGAHVDCANGQSDGSGGAAAEHVDSICRVFPSVTVLRRSHSRRSHPCGERMVLEEWQQKAQGKPVSTCHFRWTLLARRLLARLRRVTFARRFRPWLRSSAVFSSNPFPQFFSRLAASASCHAEE